MFQPYPRRRRIYVKILYTLMRRHWISYQTYGAWMRSIIGKHRED